jgi:gamma-glutamyl-gamma-aminobutyrate hydrolase PuuD
MTTKRTNEEKKPDPDEKQVLSVKPSTPRVYVVGGGYEYIKLMFELGYSGAKGLWDADLVLFTGGEDVDPQLYGEAALQTTYYNRPRDDRESKIYEDALELGLGMIGICRGGQFLNVKNKGKMWQHVNGHATGRSHLLYRVDEKGMLIKPGILATSTHHQMMRPADEAVVLAVACEATNLVSHRETHEKTEAEASDIEVVYYPDTNCLCFQPHPEMKSATEGLVKYFDECVENYVLAKSHEERKEN